MIGECYLHGFMDAEAFLGPLQELRRVKCELDPAGYWYPYFIDVTSNYETADDPRLGSMPPEWERVESERNPDDPPVFVRFKNNVTGEAINSDPRMLSESLKKRNLDLQIFQLI